MDKIFAARNCSVHVLRKYMRAFISHESPRNLTAGMSLAEARAVLSFEYNIALSSRQSLQIADNSNRTRLQSGQVKKSRSRIRMLMREADNLSKSYGNNNAE